MVRRIFASGLLAGLAAGAVAAALQAVTTTPLILRAEVFEAAHAAAHAAAGHVHAAADQAHAPAGLTLGRLALSSLATVSFGAPPRPSSRRASSGGSSRSRAPGRGSG